MTRLPLVCLLLAPLAAQAETPARFCARVGTDDTLRPIPAGLVPAVNAAFGTRMPTDAAIRTTVFRCVDGRVAVCTAGANLPCGKADVSRTNAGSAAWCKDNPDADSVPAFATGHDTIHAWRCRAGRPEITGQTSAVDPRGFVAAYWKTLP